MHWLYTGSPGLCGGSRLVLMLSNYFVCSFFIRHILMLSPPKKGKMGRQVGRGAGNLASADISFSYGGYTVVQESDHFKKYPLS
jgi:hypothetical protein